MSTLPAGVTLVTNIKGNKGDTGTIAFASAESLPANAEAFAEMVGPEDNRGVVFGVPRGLPGVNAVENDAAVAAYIQATDSDVRAALESQFTPLPSATRNALTGWVHMDGAGVSVNNTPLENANAIQAVLDNVGHKATLYFGDVFAQQEIPVATDVITVAFDEVTLIGSYAKSVYNPKIKGIGAGTILTVTGNAFNMQGINLTGDGDYSSGTFTATVDGIKWDRSVIGIDEHFSNLDGKIRDCCFSWLRQCVDAVGRNIDFIDNLFSSSIKGIRFSRFPGISSYGFRINGNRFHSMGGNIGTDLAGAESICIENVDGVFNNQIINNYADSVRHFYRGGAAATQFNNNMLINIAGIGFDLSGSAAANAWTMCGNYYSGAPGSAVTMEQAMGFDTSPEHFLKVTGAIRHGSITGNTVNYTSKHAISIDSGNILTITGNTIIDPGAFGNVLGGVIHDGIYLAGGGSCVISGNRIRSTNLGGGPNMRYGINVANGGGHRIDGNIISEFLSGDVNASNLTTKIDDLRFQELQPRAGSAGVPMSAFYVDSADGNSLKFRDAAGVIRKVAFQ